MGSFSFTYSNRPARKRVGEREQRTIESRKRFQCDLFAFWHPAGRARAHTRRLPKTLALRRRSVRLLPAAPPRDAARLQGLAVCRFLSRTTGSAPPSRRSAPSACRCRAASARNAGDQAASAAPRRSSHDGRRLGARKRRNDPASCEVAELLSKLTSDSTVNVERDFHELGKAQERAIGAREIGRARSGRARSSRSRPACPRHARPMKKPSLSFRGAHEPGNIHTTTLGRPERHGPRRADGKAPASLARDSAALRLETGNSCWTHTVASCRVGQGALAPGPRILARREDVGTPLRGFAHPTLPRADREQTSSWGSGSRFSSARRSAWQTSHRAAPAAPTIPARTNSAPASPAAACSRARRTASSPRPSPCAHGHSA